MYIKTIDKFDGDIIEKNEKRIAAIKELTSDNSKLMEIIESFENAIVNDNINKIHNMVQNELFFEVITEDEVRLRINKISKTKDRKEKLATSYMLCGKMGFRVMMNKVARS